MKLHKPRLGLFMKSMFFTSKTINRAIILLIVSICICAQFASASHTHSDIENSPEPSVCVMCLASNQDDDGNLDIPPSLPTPFVIPNTLNFDLALKSGETLGVVYNYNGEPVETVKAPVSGYMLYGLAGPPVSLGESVVTIAKSVRTLDNN